MPRLGRLPKTFLVLFFIEVAAVAEARAQSTTTGASADSVNSKEQPPRDTLIIDHAAKVVRLRGVRVGKGEDVALRRPYGAVLHVVNSNSALYACTTKEESVPAPGLDSLNIWLKLAGDYLPVFFGHEVDRFAKSKAVNAMKSGRGETMALNIPVERPRVGMAKNFLARADTLRYQTARFLRDADTLVWNRSGLIHLQLTVDSVVTAMRTNGGKVERLPTAFVPYCEKWEDKCLAVFHLNALSRSNSEAANRRRSVEDFVEAIQDSVYAAKDDSDVKTIYLQAKAIADETLKGVDSFLADAQKIRKAATELDDLVIRLSAAKESFECDPLAMDWQTGRNVTLSIKPVDNPVLAPAATRQEYSISFKAVPRWPVTTSVGLAFIGAVGPGFINYGTATNPSGGVTVVEKSRVDRFTYGLTLAFRPSVIERNYVGKRSGWAWWPVELTLNPESSKRSMGIGTALSSGILRLGTGLWWAQHSALKGQSPGQNLTSADQLSVRDAYGRRRGYVSLSLSGLPPFLPK